EGDAREAGQARVQHLGGERRIGEGHASPGGRVGAAATSGRGSCLDSDDSSGRDGRQPRQRRGIGSAILTPSGINAYSTLAPVAAGGRHAQRRNQGWEEGQGRPGARQWRWLAHARLAGRSARERPSGVGPMSGSSVERGPPGMTSRCARRRGGWLSLIGVVMLLTAACAQPPAAAPTTAPAAAPTAEPAAAAPTSAAAPTAPSVPAAATSAPAAATTASSGAAPSGEPIP